MIDPKTFAASTLQILQKNPLAYRCFGVYWYFVKALLKRHYTRDNLYMLGDFVDPTIVERMPKFDNAHDLLAAAIEEFQHNRAFGLLSSRIEDPDGEIIDLHDPDTGL